MQQGAFRLPVRDDVAPDGHAGEDVDFLDEGVLRHIDGGGDAFQLAGNIEGLDDVAFEIERVARGVCPLEGCFA